MLKSLLRSLFLYLYGRLFGGQKRGLKMPSLERFFNPQMRVFSANITSMPGARLYFFEAGSTTPKVTYADKQGTTPNANPVIASPTGTFPPIFLDGLYRVELRSSANIVQPGWPIDNVGQDNPIVPYAAWSEIVTYAEFERVTDPLTGTVYRSTNDDNLGNVPADSPSDWEVVIDPVASSFTSNNAGFTWSDEGAQISLDVDLSAAGILSPADTSPATQTSVTWAPQRSGTVNYRKVGNLVYGTFTVVRDAGGATGLFTLPVGFRPAADCYGVAGRGDSLPADPFVIRSSGLVETVGGFTEGNTIYGSFIVLS